MRPLFVVCLGFVLTAPAPNASSPILEYIAKNEYITKEFVLSKKDDETLKDRVTDPAYFDRLLKGKIPFRTKFLDKYKSQYPSPKRIVENYVKQVELNFLSYVHTILTFFIKPNGEFEDLDGLFSSAIDGYEHTKELEGMIDYWVKQSPSGRDNVKDLITHLHDGPFDEEILPFITRLSTLIKQKYPESLERISTAIETTYVELDILPDELYNFAKRSFNQLPTP
ncbi:hypothetical protein DSO57_1005708 [Entomophthora muscae]|uniref:Uncharacterized protein n=1 Tax=Entomophthora muscae TaxID=34485 RepID=A0ACC2SKZ1_9FUNG|nr:hypothetical protein DSO57_1005708 [Entomophthora muscae]